MEIAIIMMLVALWYKESTETEIDLTPVYERTWYAY